MSKKADSRKSTAKRSLYTGLPPNCGDRTNLWDLDEIVPTFLTRVAIAYLETFYPPLGKQPAQARSRPESANAESHLLRSDNSSPRSLAKIIESSHLAFADKI